VDLATEARAQARDRRSSVRHDEAAARWREHRTVSNRLTDQAAALLCWSCDGSGRDTDICGCCEVDCEECEGTGLRCSEPPVRAPEPPRTPEQIASDEAAYQERLAAMSPMQRATLEALNYMRMQLYAPLRRLEMPMRMPMRFDGIDALVVSENAKSPFVFGGWMDAPYNATVKMANAMPPDGVLAGVAPKPSDLFWYRQHDEEARRALRQAGVIPWLPPLTDDELLDEQIAGRT
jgi:hypothetical protein